MGDDILGVIFLALICIVIAGIINKVAPAGMMIPTFALMAVCLWVAYDYILLQRYKAKQRCSGKSDDINPVGKSDDINSASKSDDINPVGKSDDINSASKSDDINSASKSDDINPVGKSDINNKDLQDMIDDLGDPGDLDKNNAQHGKTSHDVDDADNDNIARAKHKNEFDIDLYSNQLSVQELHKDMGCAGDNKLANRMKYMMLQPKMSHDARARMNRYTLLQFWEEELRDNENRDWWDAEQDHLDAYM
jgi:hypothetical protein